MKGRYRGLVFLGVFLRICGVIVAAFGIGVSLLYLFYYSESHGVTSVAAAVYIVVSLIFGAIIYSLGELIKLMLDIKDDIDNKLK